MFDESGFLFIRNDVDVKLDFSSTVGKMSYGLLRFIYPIKKFYWCWSVFATMILILVENYPISSYSLVHKHFLQTLELPADSNRFRVHRLSLI